MFSSQSHQEQHEMHLVQTHDTGAEEWHCPTCGRRFLLHWPPDYRKEVIETGDEYAIHTGGKGGLQMQAPQPLLTPHVSQPEPDVEISGDLRAALEEALADIDFDGWPDEGDEAGSPL